MKRTLSLLSIVALCLGPVEAATRDDFLNLARKGWVYELRSAMWRPDPDRKAVKLSGRLMADAGVCLLGAAPTRQSIDTLKTFTGLLADIYGRGPQITHASGGIDDCNLDDRVFIRLYSGQYPHGDFNHDLRHIDLRFGIGLPNRDQYAMSPAQAQTFFGRNGQVTHIFVKQADTDSPTPLERAFFGSILIEELYQSFTFGMDILHFDRRAKFVSKLEEFPLNLRNAPWDSDFFMQGLLKSNPSGLCRFDIFMLHALAETDVEETNTVDFLAYIERSFDQLEDRTAATLQETRFNGILDQDCLDGPE